MLAALIIAAAVIMQVPTTVRLFGYPALAMILFVAAATGGALLAVQIVTHDKSSSVRLQPDAHGPPEGGHYVRTIRSA